MDILQQLQLDAKAYLDGIAATVNTPVFVVRARDEGEAIEIQTNIDKALAGLTFKPDEETGKCGLAIIILMTEGGIAEGKMRGPYMDLRLTVRVIEKPMINMGETGTQIPCEEMALTVLGALHNLDLGKGHKLEGVEGDAVKVVNITGSIAYDVNLRCYHQEPSQSRVADITLANAANTITLATATGGASIYYTEDGTFPNSTNGTLYTVPFVITPPVTLRACAFKTGLSPSNVKEQSFT